MVPSAAVTLFATTKNHQISKANPNLIVFFNSLQDTKRHKLYSNYTKYIQTVKKC
jgi:hypothetical protein